MPASRLKTLDCAITGSPPGIAYVAAAARVADALTQDVLLAPWLIVRVEENGHE